MKITLFEQPLGDHRLTALILLISGVFIIALQDSLIKLMSVQTSFWQFQFLRSLGNVGFVMLLAMLGSGIALVVPSNSKAVYLRAIFLMVCMFFFFAGAPYLSVTQMGAGLYTYPLFVSLLAAPVLGEIVGRWRLAAIAVGFIGAALVLSPWDETFSAVQLLPIIAGFFYAANILTLRKACRNESPLALAFAAGIVYILSSAAGIFLLGVFALPKNFVETMPFVAIGWPESTLVIVGFALFASVLNLAANICMTRAYQTAEASWLAPMDYTYLVFAAIWGWLLFDHWPTGQALAGMTLIASAGIVTGWRERVSAAKRKAGTGP